MTIILPNLTDPQPPVGAVDASEWRADDRLSTDPEPEFGMSPSLFRFVSSPAAVAPGPVDARVWARAEQSADGSLVEQLVAINAAAEPCDGNTEIGTVYVTADQARAVARMLVPAAATVDHWNQLAKPLFTGADNKGPADEGPEAPVGATDIDDWEDDFGVYRYAPDSVRVVRSGELIAADAVPAIVTVSALQRADGKLEDPVIRISMGTDDIFLPLGAALGVAQALGPATELLAKWIEVHHTYRSDVVDLLLTVNSNDLIRAVSTGDWRCIHARDRRIMSDAEVEVAKSATVEELTVVIHKLDEFSRRIGKEIAARELDD